MTQQKPDKIIEERTHEEVYKEFKEALVKASEEDERYLIAKGINLEDILMALSKNEYRIAVRVGGRFFVEEYNIDNDTYLLTNELDIKWIIGEPASKQSSETLRELTKLLK